MTTSRAPLRLIVHGDDFGLSETIDDGIVRAHTRGILTSTSLIAAGNAFEHAIALARRHPTLDVGVHLTLTEARPVCAPGAVPSLAAAGEALLPNPFDFVKRFLRGAISLRDVERELAAQVARVLDTGVRVTHLDGHQHLHALPGIRGVVGALAQRHGIRFVRRPIERLRGFMFREPARGRRIAALLALDLVCAWPARWNAATTDRFAGFYYGGVLNKTNLLAQVDGLPQSGTCELMCHPGIEITREQNSVYDRRAEYDALCDPDVRAALTARAIELVSFADLYER